MGPRAPSHSASVRLCGPSPQAFLQSATLSVLDPCNYFCETAVRTLSLKLAFLINSGGLFSPLLSGPGGAWRGPCPLHRLSLPARCLLRRRHRRRPPQATGSLRPTDTPDSFPQLSFLLDSPETTRCGPRTPPRRGCTQAPVKGAGKVLPGHEQVAARPSGGTRVSPAGSLRSSCTARHPSLFPGDAGAAAGSHSLAVTPASDPRKA